MQRGISVHIGVNQPASAEHCKLSLSEKCAWRMAGVAYQAGYGSIHLLRGADATRGAVRRLLSRATRALQPDQTLFVSYSGHGSHAADLDGDEPDGQDETWCLHDAGLTDDELVRIWRKAPAGSRVVVVSESCYAGGMRRDDGFLDECSGPPAPVDRPVYRSDGPVTRGVKQYAPTLPSSCIPRMPDDDDGIKASVLVMAGAAEAQTAQEGLYTHHLLKLWNGGAFRGSFCALHRSLCQRVQNDNPAQVPQIMMLGTASSDPSLAPAFHLHGPVTRGR